MSRSDRDACLRIPVKKKLIHLYVGPSCHCHSCILYVIETVYRVCVQTTVFTAFHDYY